MSKSDAKAEEKERKRWIYLTTYPDGKPCGMRTWSENYRADINWNTNTSEFDYWISETWNSGRDVYWTKTRHGSDVFKVMQLCETWLEEMEEALFERPDSDDDY